jgi:outer membrane biosynthesis protein TonB
MRFWNPLRRPFRPVPPRDGLRCWLVVEQLETRDNRAPLLAGPVVGSTPEGMPQTFGASNAFSLSDPANAGQDYTATLTAAAGTITFSAAALAVPGVTVQGDGTSAVTLTGPLDALDTVLNVIDPSFTYDPGPFYSGDGFTLTVDDGLGGTASVTTRVTPEASPATLAVNPLSEQFAPTALGFPLVGAFTVSNWPDADGSETLTVRLSLDPATDPTGFTLTGPGGPITPQPDGSGGFFWAVSATNPSDLQAKLDSLVLTPPSSFTGRTGLLVSAALVDTATYSTAPATETATNSAVGTGSIPLRFFLGTNVSIAAIPTALPGTTVDLGGRFVGTDPDLLTGDLNQFAFEAPSGTLTFDGTLADSAGVSFGSQFTGTNGNTVVLLSGSLTALNAFLAMPNSLTYTPASTSFVGSVPVSVTLLNITGVESPPSPGAFHGTATVTFAARETVPPTNNPTPVPVDPTTEPQPEAPPEPAPEPEPPPDPLPDPVNEPEPPPEPDPDTEPAPEPDTPAPEPDASADASTDAAPPVPTEPEDEVPQVAPDPRTPDSADDSPTDTSSPAFNFVIDLSDLGDSTDDGDPDVAVPQDEVTAGEAGADVGGDTDGAEDDRPAEMTTRPAVLPEAFASSIPLSTVVAEGRVGQSAGVGSLFAQPDPPQPAYGGNDRHPLPPVLPLDHSTAAAGFTESGGDSFALIDQLLRGEPLAPATPGLPAAPAVAPKEANPVAAPVAPVAPAAPPALPAPPAPPAPAPGREDAVANGWQFWAGGALIGGAAAAWAVLSLDRNGRLARWVRRRLHPTRPATA